ncbi:hypothetical protein T484DRAFT_1765779, partial [Baffinella frigidus]
AHACAAAGSAEHMALLVRELFRLDLLAEEGEYPCRTALHLAADASNTPVVEWLFKAGACVAAWGMKDARARVPVDAICARDLPVSRPCLAAAWEAPRPLVREAARPLARWPSRVTPSFVSLVHDLSSGKAALEAAMPSTPFTEAVVKLLGEAGGGGEGQGVDVLLGGRSLVG